MLKRKIKAIIFDFDGVVIDSLPRAFEVWEFAFKKFKKKNVKLDRDFFEVDYRDLAKKINISEQNMRELEKLFFHSKTPVYLFKGMKKILNTLSKKYKLALVSNNPPNRLRKRLKQYNIFNYFKAVVGIRKGIRLKPNPDMIHLALNKLKAKPEEAVFIGDMEGDILAGKAAKVFVIGASYGFHTHVRLKGADVIIDSQNDIIPTIRKIEEGSFKNFNHFIMNNKLNKLHQNKVTILK